MRFFMTKHYSIAEKVIDIVQSKIRANINNHPKIVKAFQKYDVLTFSAYVVNKRQLAEVLGDILQENLPTNLYNRYEQLKKKDQNELCTKIATHYFYSLNFYTKSLNNIKINISCGGDHRWGDDVEAQIFLPEEYYDKHYLAKEIQHSIASVRQVLLEPIVHAQQSSTAAVTAIQSQINSHIEAKDLSQENRETADLTEDARRAAAFKKIYDAMRAGQTSFRKDANFLEGKRDLSTASLIEKIKSTIFNDPKSFVAKAWKLAQSHYNDCTVGNIQLFTEIYKYSFEKSGLFSISKLSGITFFRSASLKLYLDRKNFTAAEIDAGIANKDSRTAHIYTALL